MKMKSKTIPVGGQAVIEGVMIKSPNFYSVSARKNKKIVSITKKSKTFSNKPFARGVSNLIEMIFLGMKSLNWSASQQGEEEISNAALTITLIISVLLGLGLFLALPYFLTLLLGIKEETAPILFNIVDGVIKIAIFLIYLFLISRINEIKRVFQYHGAEHKAIYCYESGKKLSVKNAKKFSTLHPRCGTSFLFIVILISIFIFALIPVIVVAIFPDFQSWSLLARKSTLFPLRILVLPIVASVSYEMLKLSAKSKQLRFLFYPGLALQKITTKEPDEKQLEVAIYSIKQVLKHEKASERN